MKGIGILGLLVAGVALLAGLFWAATGALDGRVAAARADLAALQVEAAGLPARIDEFRAAGEASALPEALLLPGAARAEAVLGLQERIVALAAAQGVTLTSFVEGSAPEGLNHPAVAMVIEGEGGTENVTGLLAALEGQSPPVGLAQVMLRPVSDQGGLSMRVLVWGFLRGEVG